MAIYTIKGDFLMENFKVIVSLMALIMVSNASAAQGSKQLTAEATKTIPTYNESIARIEQVKEIAKQKDIQQQSRQTLAEFIQNTKAKQFKGRHISQAWVNIAVTLAMEENPNTTFYNVLVDPLVQSIQILIKTLNLKPMSDMAIEKMIQIPLKKYPQIKQGTQQPQSKQRVVNFATFTKLTKNMDYDLFITTTKKHITAFYHDGQLEPQWFELAKEKGQEAGYQGSELENKILNSARELLRQAQKKTILSKEDVLAIAKLCKVEPFEELVKKMKQSEF